MVVLKSSYCVVRKILWSESALKKKPTSFKPKKQNVSLDQVLSRQNKYFSPGTISDLIVLIVKPNEYFTKKSLILNTL